MAAGDICAPLELKTGYEYTRVYKDMRGIEHKEKILCTCQRRDISYISGEPIYYNSMFYALWHDSDFGGYYNFNEVSRGLYQVYDRDYEREPENYQYVQLYDYPTYVESYYDGWKELENPSRQPTNPNYVPTAKEIKEAESIGWTEPEILYVIGIGLSALLFCLLLPAAVIFFWSGAYCGYKLYVSRRDRRIAFDMMRRRKSYEWEK